MKKITSTVLALLIAGSSSSKNISKAYASDKRNKTSIENIDFSTKVKETFGWTNLDKEIILEDKSLGIILFNMDNKEYLLATHATKINDDKNVLFTDIEDDQPIFEILRTNSYVNLVVTKYYDYFPKEADIKNIDVFYFDKNTFEYHIQESIPDDFSQPMPIYRLAELLLKIKFLNIQSCYIKSKIKTFADLEYKNIVPNNNDNEYIKKDDFEIIFDPAKKIRYDNNGDASNRVVFFAKKTLSSSDGYKLDDVFSEINLTHFISSKNGTLINHYNSLFDKAGWISSMSIDEFFQHVYPEATSYFRDIEEVIDGDKCYNVGKLRKIYENLDPSLMVDYDKLLNMDTTKFLPMSKDIDNDKVLYAVNKPKTKELVNKS